MLDTTKLTRDGDLVDGAVVNIRYGRAMGNLEGLARGWTTAFFIEALWLSGKLLWFGGGPVSVVVCWIVFASLFAVTVGWKTKFDAITGPVTRGDHNKC